MALKLIQQDASTLREAFLERKAEYEALRATGRWSGAVLYTGTLLELALKLVMSKNFGVSNLPTIFQVHDLELLLCCSGVYPRLNADERAYENFLMIHKRWSMSLRYEGAIQTQRDADAFDLALLIWRFLIRHKAL